MSNPKQTSEAKRATRWGGKRERLVRHLVHERLAAGRSAVREPAGKSGKKQVRNLGR